MKVSRIDLMQLNYEEDVTMEHANAMPALQVAPVDDHDLPIPQRESAGAAGFDLRANTDGLVLAPGEQALVPTGYRWQLPPGWCGQIWPRSGLAVKREADRRAGLIDADYRGEVKALIRNEGREPLAIDYGDRIAQLVIVPYYLGEPVLANVLDETERGDGGFESTGRN